MNQLQRHSTSRAVAYVSKSVIETQARGSLHQHLLLYDGTVVTTTQDDDGGIECTDK